MYTLNCKGKLLVIDQPLIMGIINATTDSFYSAPSGQAPEDGLRLAGKMIGEGADILDIGGQSTRPGSKRIDAPSEIGRVLPVIEAIRSKYPDIIISIDTYHSRVAEAAVHAGASIVNDISAGAMDAAMIDTVAALKVPYVCMHMKGSPENMQQHAVYEDVVKEVLDYFIFKTEQCRKAGIHDLIIDPGFGFAKTIAHNFQLLKDLELLKIIGKPVLAGLSRKSTVYKTLQIPVEDALNGSTVLNTIAVLHGADILRVHDVKAAKEVVRLIAAFKKE